MAIQFKYEEGAICEQLEEGFPTEIDPSGFQERTYAQLKKLGAEGRRVENHRVEKDGKVLYQSTLHWRRRVAR